MNYVRRPNRPDGSLYRQMRRQRLSRSPHDAVRRLWSARSALVAVAVALLLWLGWWLTR